MEFRFTFYIFLYGTDKHSDIIIIIIIYSNTLRYRLRVVYVRLYLHHTCSNVAFVSNIIQAAEGYASTIQWTSISAIEFAFTEYAMSARNKSTIQLQIRKNLLCCYRFVWLFRNTLMETFKHCNWIKRAKKKQCHNRETYIQVHSIVHYSMW